MHETIPEAAKKDKGERQKGRNKCRENGILAIEITIIIGAENRIFLSFIIFYDARETMREFLALYVVERGDSPCHF